MKKPKICVSINEKNSVNASERVRKLEDLKPDFYEIRFDLMEDTREIELIRNSTDVPLIATNRLKTGGESDSEKKRIGLLSDACVKGYEYVDFDINNRGIVKTLNLFRDLGAKLILSSHDFNITPCLSELNKIMNKQVVLGADICKIIGTAKNVQDNLIYLNFLQTNHTTNLVSFGMGGEGTISRILSPVFGGVFTYASAEVGLEVADGQPTISELKKIYQLMRI
ncbi:MAG: type I 3-dehydroquinate dehydratase [Candidatus Thorarchaeota archaeon]|nr:type I 3-dehydroquinate dehydratase [Candidatus Thorarchaeota archaeon]